MMYKVTKQKRKLTHKLMLEYMCEEEIELLI